MPRKVLKQDEQRKGEGIYASFEKSQQETRHDTATVPATEANYQQPQPDCLRAATDSNSCLSDDRIGHDLETTQQVLDALDQQINILNELKFNQQQKQTSYDANKQPSDSSDCYVTTSDTHSRLATAVGRRNSFVSPSPSASGAATEQLEQFNWSARKSFLNHYIRHSIDETGECGCHFEIELDDVDDNVDERTNLQLCNENNLPNLSEYSIGCNAKRQSFDDSNVNCGSSNVLLGLTGNQTIDSCCCRKRQHAKLLIDYDNNDAGEFAGKVANGIDERDLAASQEKHQPRRLQLEALAGVGAGKHRCIGGAEICEIEGGSRLPRSDQNYIIEWENNSNYNYNYPGTSINTLGSACPSGSCAIGHHTNSEQKSSSSSCLSLDCESELGNALEGLVDSLNSAEPHSYCSSPTLLFGPPPDASIAQIEPQCPLYATEQKLKTRSLGNSSNIEHHHYQSNNNSYSTRLLNEQDCGPSNLITPLSWSQDFPPSSITNNNINNTINLKSQQISLKDKQQQDDHELNLRRQLYSELNAKFLLARKLKNLPQPEGENCDTDKDLTKNTTNYLDLDNVGGFELAMAEGPRLVRHDDCYHGDSSLFSSINETKENRGIRIEKEAKHNITKSSRRRFKARASAHKRFKVLESPLTLSSYPSSSSSPTTSTTSEALTSASRTTANELNNSCCLARRHQEEGAESSMRTVRDIAKISIPSLASLQYLPNQIDIEKSLRRRRRTRRLTSTSTSTTASTRQQRPMKRDMENSRFRPSGGGQVRGGSVRVISAAESRDDVQHESGLLHNLCLCNCMAKSQHHDEATTVAADSQEQESSSRLLRQKRRTSHDKKARKSDGSGKGEEDKSLRDVRGSQSSPSLKSPMGVEEVEEVRGSKSPSSRASETTTTTNPSDDEDVGLSLKSESSSQDLEKKTKKKKTRVDSKKKEKLEAHQEKQSPSFLNILRSSAHISHNFRQHLAPLAGQRVESRQGPQTATDGSIGNSVGDLEATESCCSSGRDSVATSGFSFMRAHSASFSGIGDGKQHQRPSSSASYITRNNNDDEEDEDAPFSDTTNDSFRAQSACSSSSAAARENPREHSRSKGGFSEHKRRFQSFFTPTNSSLASHRGSLRRVDETKTSQIGLESPISTSTNEANNTNKKNKNKSKRKKDNELQGDQQSFFTRSLNRLSSTRKQSTPIESLSKLTTNHHHQEPQKVARSTSLLSPTISISTVSSQTNKQLQQRNEFIPTDDETLEDVPQLVNANSPPAHRLRSASLLKPGIVFDRVNYTGGGGGGGSSSTTTTSQGCLRSESPSSSIISCDMTRTGNNRRQSQVSSEASSCIRYGSEISNYAVANDDMRACSLPASPHGLRRSNLGGGSHRQLAGGGGGGRSQRLTRSPVPFPSPANESTKIEDGLKVCSTEHFEKHIGNIKGIQVEAQKQLFKAWINHYCPNLIRGDLVDELRDGIKLIGLIGSLTRDKKLLATYDKLIGDKQAYINRLVVTPSSRLRHLSNVSIALDYLSKKLNMKMINLNPMDVVSGKPNVTLGLCWNIILNFQFEQQNFLLTQLQANSGPGHHGEEEEEDSIIISNSTGQRSDSSASNCTSRLSYDETKEEGSMGARGHQKHSIKTDCGSRRMIERDDYSAGLLDFAGARKKLLNHINKRFNLKLTNLTSNLLDGDVLYVILKQLAPQAVEREITANIINWKGMGNDEKLDHCFQLAQDHLQVPRLFSASDLKFQIETDNLPKPLLVYLSMLLKTPSSNEETEYPSPSPEPDHIHNKLVGSSSSSQTTRSLQDSPSLSLEARLRNCVNELDREDKFELDKLQSTLIKIKELEKILHDVKSTSKQQQQQLDENLLASSERLVDEANQVEGLIGWINRADSLFETRHKSPIELTRAIDHYREFFSPGNVPQVAKITAQCPTLERQYRECLSSAKQRVLLMEQTLKNWDGYEKARRQLKEWLSIAELKLANALRPAAPNATADLATEAEVAGGGGNQSLDTLERHTSLLEDLIDYFELEPIDTILMNESMTSGPNASFLNHKLPSLESLPSSLLGSMNESLSGSVLSIGSNSSSRYSTLQCSTKATYNKLFDDFELKCRLLASQLDPDQKDALLMGVRELKYRLRHITEQKVPQVVSELKYYISRCEMSIEEQEEENDDDDVDVDDQEQEDADESGEQVPTQETITTDVMDSPSDSDVSEVASQVSDSIDLVSNDASSARDPIENDDLKTASSATMSEKFPKSSHPGAAVTSIINKPEAIPTTKETHQGQNEPAPKKLSQPEKPATCKPSPSKITATRQQQHRQQKLDSKSEESNRNNKSSESADNGCRSGEKVSSVADKSKPDDRHQHHESWSFLKWFLADGKKDKEQAEVIGSVKRAGGGSKSKRKARSNNKLKSDNSKQRNKTKPTVVAVAAAHGGKQKKVQEKDKTNENLPGDITFTRLFWSKLIRAYRASMPLNIILLICLAGVVCVVPLMNKDACCELTQGHIPTEEFSLNQKPT